MTKIVAAPVAATPDPAGAGATADVALRPPASWPEWLGATSFVALPVLAAWEPLVRFVGREPACLVRATLGVPCPLCGGITAGRALVDLDVGAALVASPLAVGLAVGAVVMLVVWVLRCAAMMRPPGHWSVTESRRAGAALSLAIVASWGYQWIRLT
jgi:hypothetical protein